MLKFITINTIAELTCFAIAFICLIKVKTRAWLSMIPFLLIICITEMIGIYLKRPYLEYVHEIERNEKLHLNLTIAQVHSNIWVYNILLLFQAGFTTFMFYYILKKAAYIKPIVISGLILFTSIYGIELCVHGIFEKNNIATIIMSVQFALYSFYYFYYLLKIDEYVDLKYSPEFWWVAGTLFFYFGRIATLIFTGLIAKINPQIVITYPIYNLLNILLYSCWSYSFICKKWLTATSKASL